MASAYASSKTVLIKKYQALKISKTPDYARYPHSVGANMTVHGTCGICFDVQKG